VALLSIPVLDLNLYLELLLLYAVCAMCVLSSRGGALLGSAPLSFTLTDSLHNRDFNDQQSRKMVSF
jgi:hypothetical protein